MGFQFAHVESYSRSGGRGGRHTIAEILSEARRSPESCLHVATPKPPILVYGRNLDELEQRHDDLVETAKEMLANGKSRSVRKDTSSLFTCILSHPATPEECQNDMATKIAVEAWAKDSVKWLRRDLEARGGILETVIMHIDESHVHLHAYGLHPSAHADRLHPGKVAKKDSVAAALNAGHDKKTANAIGDKAYVEVMRTWQDSYSHDIGLPHGLTRLGPARRRLSRAEWMAEKAAAKSVQEARTLAKGATDEAKAAQAIGDRILAEARQEAALQALAAHRRIDEAARIQATAVESAAKAKTTLQAARQERDRILSQAMIELGRLRSFGSMIRALWDSFRVSSIRQNVRQEMQTLFDREANRTASLSGHLRQESLRRQETEKRLADAVHSARSVGLDRDRIRRERDRLLDPAMISNLENRPKFP